MKIKIPHFQKQSIFPPGYQGCIFGVVTLEVLRVIMRLAVCLTAGTVDYQRPSDLLCDGRLSAGFPLAFVCDASGESPLSSVGKIDWADAGSINLPGSLADIVFYNVLLWITLCPLNPQKARTSARVTLFIVHRIFHVAGAHNRSRLADRFVGRFPL